jgi:hypothetical protein
MNFGEAFERSPGRGLGDGNIRIAGNKRFAVRGVYDADGKSCRHERKEGSDFRFGERMHAVIGGKNRGGRGERIVLTKGGIGSGDGGFGDGDGFVHVAKIDDRDNLAWLRPRW